MALSWKHVVPWTNRSEFVQTYLDLYSKNAERQRNAVETISLWKCRATNKLSVAIESSAALTDVYLQYQTALEKKKLRQKSNNLRSIMTLAMIRFVNHVTEKGQNKHFAQPVHKIAQEFGIPNWIVQLRHDGTHGSIPCLDVLTKAVQWALTYLQDVFWSQQVKEADECTDPDTRKRKRPIKSLYNSAEIKDLLFRFQKASHKSVDEGPDSEAAREEKRTLRRIEHALNSQQRNNVLACLVEPGHLVLTEQQLHAYHVNLDETLRAEHPRVPGVIISIWKELLLLIHGKQLTSLLLQHMVKKVTGEGDRESLQSLMLAAWLRLVLLYETSNYSKTADERASQPALYSGAIDFAKDLLFYTCLESKNFLTCRLLSLAGDLSPETERELDELDKVYSGRRGRTTAASKDHSDDETAVREEEEAQSPVKKLKLNVPAEEESIWKLCTDPVDWEKLPIGLLPSQANLEDFGSEEEHRSHDDYSSTDEDGRSTEDELDTSKQGPPTSQNPRERSSENTEKDDLVKHIIVH